MDFLTSKPVIRIRRTLRGLGVNPNWFRRRLGIEREAEFRKRLMEAVRPGDVVWDVGAAWGAVSTELAERVSPDGKVVAFEPDENFSHQIAEKAKRLPNLIVVQKAMGSSAAIYGSSSGQNQPRVGASWQSYEGTIEVTTGDIVHFEHGIPFPNIMKIDVEGFELEVLKGCVDIFKDERLRSVFVEVHFRILDETGRKNVPAEILAFFEDRGFQTQWSDSSHLIANRK